MVSTRYELAKTRSQKLRKFSFTNGAIKNDYIYPGRTNGSFKHIIISPNSKSNKDMKPISPKKINKKLIMNKPKPMPSPIENKPKRKQLKPKNSVTKIVMPCKISNKTNCPVHKKQQNCSVTKIKNVKKAIPTKIGNSKLQEKIRSYPVGNVKALLNLNNRVTKRAISAKISARKNKAPGTSKVTMEKPNLQVELECNEQPVTSPGVTKSAKLSPVTFKKSIRIYLMQEIAKKLIMKDKSCPVETVNDVSENVSTISDVANKPPTGNSQSISTLQEKSSPSSPETPVLLHRNKSNRPTHIPNQLISTHETCTDDSSAICDVTTSEVPTSPCSTIPYYFLNNSTNTNHSIAQKDPKVFRPKISDKLSSLLNKSNSFTNSKSATGIEYNTRSSIFRHHVFTRNTLKNCKFAKLGLKNLMTPNDPYSNRKAKVAKAAPNVQIEISSSVSNANSKPAFQNKTLSKPKANSSSQVKGKFAQSAKHNDKELHSKMMKTMAKKFGPSPAQRTESVVNNQNENLEEEILNTSDELEAVDKYLNAKILSFKLKKSFLEFPREFPQASHKRASALLMHRLAPIKRTKCANKKFVKATNKTEVHRKKKALINGKRKQSPNMKSKQKQLSVKSRELKKKKKNYSILEPAETAIEWNNPSLEPSSSNSISHENLENPPMKDKETTDETNNCKVSNDKPNTSHTTTSRSRTVFPLTLKARFVMVNGKKIKKKLSQKEQRIYNLLRVYGNNTLGNNMPAPEQVLAETPKQVPLDKASTSKTIQTTSENNEKDKKKMNPMKKAQKKKEDQHCKKIQEAEKRSSKVELTNDDGHGKEKVKPHDTIKKKIKLHGETHEEEGNTHMNKKTSVEKTKRSLKEKDKLDNVSSMNKSPIQSAEKLTSKDKEKRQLHRAKYKILKDFENSPSETERRCAKSDIIDHLKQNSSSETFSDSMEDEIHNTRIELKKKSVKFNARDAILNVKRNRSSNNVKALESKQPCNISKKLKKSVSVEKINTKKLITSTRSIDQSSNKTRENTTISTISSGIESADDVDFRLIENLTNKTNRKEMEKTRTYSKKTLEHNSDSDESVSSFLQKYRTTSIKKSKESITCPQLTTKKQDKRVSKNQTKFQKGDKCSSINLDKASANSKETLSEKDRRSQEFSKNMKSLTQSVGTQNTSITSTESPNSSTNQSNSTSKIVTEDIASDVDIFDDSRDLSTSSKKLTSKSSNEGSMIGRRLSCSQEEKKQNSTDDFQSKARNEKKKQEYKEIVSEHVNKFKTRDLVQTLKQWTSNESQNQLRFPSTGSKERDVGNYRDYTTRTGVAHNPIRILKKKVCEGLKKQLKNEYKNGHNGKDYFQCICFNKFFITRVTNADTHNFDILNVKVKPNKSENVLSLNDVQFCTFCSRLYEKYKDNFILINQEYIMREFIEQHTKSWNRINKAYDNELDMNATNMSMSHPCNLSFASTNTSTPYESQSNSRTESRLDSISSDKNESITQGSDFSDFYLNEVFLLNMKRSTDPSRLAASHEFQQYKQKCRSVNMKINEICDLYSAKRKFSTETRSNATDDHDDIFMRPSSITPSSQYSKESHVDYSTNRNPCKGSVPDAHTRKPCYFSDSLEEDISPPKEYRTPTSSCSKNSVLSPGKKYLYKHRMEKTRESFEQMFQNIWTKCSPCKRSRNSNLSRRAKKFKPSHEEYPSYSKMYKKHGNKSLVSSDVTDEYDADFSDSNPNHDSSDDCLNYTHPTLKSRSSQYTKDKQDSLNRSLGNNFIYKERHHETVNRLLIKQSQHLFTNKKTSYSDSEQVIKIQNVKKKVYTTIHRKVYDDLLLNRNGKKGNREFEANSRRDNNPCSTCCSQNIGSDESKDMRNGVAASSNINTSMRRTQMEINRDRVHSTNSLANEPNKTVPLRNKIQEIQCENLRKKLASDEQVGNVVEGITETDHSDCIMETDSEEFHGICKIRQDEAKIRIMKSEIQPDMELCENLPTTNELQNKNDEITTNTEDEANYTYVAGCDNSNLLSESLVFKIEQSTPKLNNYEHIKEEIKTYASAVRRDSTAFNKQTVLKLIKNLVKNRSVTFEDYAEHLKYLNININLNSRNEFMIKHVSRFTDQDDQIMKQCFDKLLAKYHVLETSLDNSTAAKVNVNKPGLVESFESFKAHLTNESIPEPKEPSVNNNLLNVDISKELVSKQVKNLDFHFNIGCDDENAFSISLSNGLVKINNLNSKDGSDSVTDSLVCDEQNQGLVLSQSSDDFVNMFIIKQEVNTPNSYEENSIVKEVNTPESFEEVNTPKSTEEKFIVK